jgi:hypothetical protein
VPFPKHGPLFGKSHSVTVRWNRNMTRGRVYASWHKEPNCHCWGLTGSVLLFNLRV